MRLRIDRGFRGILSAKLVVAVALVFACLQAKAWDQHLESVCKGSSLSLALATAEQYLNGTTPSSNSDALECVLAVSDDIDAGAGSITSFERYRLANIGSNAIEQAGGPAAVGDMEGWNERVADMWGRYLAGGAVRSRSERVRATKMLIVHGRQGSFTRHLPTALDSLIGFESQVPSDLPKLLFSTLYRCPAWGTSQASNQHSPDQVPCLQGCRDAAQLVNKRIGDLLGRSSGVSTSSLLALRDENARLTARLVCKGG